VQLMESMIIQPTSPSEATARQPGTVEVESSVFSPADSAEDVREGVAETGREFQLASSREPASTLDEKSDLDLPGRPATSEILPEDASSWELVEGDDEREDTGTRPAGSQPDDPLPQLAKQIVTYRQRMLRAARTAFDEYIRIGLALIDAKGYCKPVRRAGRAAR
jgi:hypothetical protein